MEIRPIICHMGVLTLGHQGPDACHPCRGRVGRVVVRPVKSVTSSSRLLFNGAKSLNKSTYNCAH